jgi:hypothetical protein
MASLFRPVNSPASLRIGGTKTKILLDSLLDHGDMASSVSSSFSGPNLPVSTDRNSLANIAFLASNEYLSARGWRQAVHVSESLPVLAH